MQQIDFQPLGRQVSCLGLGCARLDGRIGLRRSRRLLETALELGITYFDVAASYGTAEEALGEVLGGAHEVVIATKVGPPEPPYNATKMRLKTLVRPVLDRVRRLKMFLRNTTAPPPQTPGLRPRYDFSQERIEQSLQASLKRLRRDRVDVLLAHEPNRLDLLPELEARFQSLVDGGAVGAFGVGVDVREDQWAPFGSIWQSGWPGESVAKSLPQNLSGGIRRSKKTEVGTCSKYQQEITRNFHGVLRYASQDQLGRRAIPPAELIRNARRAAPNSVLLVSASTPERLRQLVEAADVRL